MKTFSALIRTIALASAHAASPDIVVYSGVPCGIAASITAAHEGAKVVLIEPTKHVGGLSTRGINTAESEHTAEGERPCPPGQTPRPKPGHRFPPRPTREM